eukprot:gene4476-4730_t
MAASQTSEASINAQSVDEIPVYADISSTQSVHDANIALDKPRVVVLGSGWASASFLKALPKEIKEKYEVVVVSPRNYFLYTPLLPAVAVGTIEERSIVDPVRNLVFGKADYYEAVCKAIDPKRKELVACFPKDAGLDEACFKIKYDILIMGVGSVNNTFGIQGVQEYCQFFKSIENASSLRRRISECFERAALPYTMEEERKKLLSFVVCGGGPTGVEVAAEMHDMIFEDLKEHYPELMPDVKIRVIELMDHVLSTYDRKIGEYTAKTFARQGIELVLNSRVMSVRDGYVKVANKNKEEYEIPFGACVWATGIAMHPLVKELQAAFPQEQNHFRSALTDEYLRVKGSDGSIWAFGDASTIDQPKALDYADKLFEQADINKDGTVSMPELARLLRDASKEFSHLEEHARFMDAKNKRFGNLVARVLGGTNSGIASNGTSTPVASMEEDDELTKEQFKAVLAQVDKGLRALPATAQVAKQQGEYLAEVLKTSTWDKKDNKFKMAQNQQPFKYFHKGSLAYVGGDKAVMDVPKIGPLLGEGVGFLWRGYETFAQISLRNQLLVFNDWVRTKLFGRDISRV